MLFSDYYITSIIKIEILPTDLMLKKPNILKNGDDFISIYRGINGNLVASICEIEFLKEFKALVESNNLSIKEALSKTIQNINFSCLNPPADLDLRPIQGAMILVLYIDPNKTIHFAQVGNIKLKMRSLLRFKTINQNHTFGNLDEVNDLKKTTFFKKHFKPNQVNDLIMKISKVCNLGTSNLDNISSRFIGHPNLCGLSNGPDDTFINTKPYIGTIKL